jgi:hypothetical protein
MDKENTVYIHHGYHKEKLNYALCWKMDRTEDHHVKLNKQDSERQILDVFSHLRNLELKTQNKIKPVNIKRGLFGREDQWEK